MALGREICGPRTAGAPHTGGERELLMRRILAAKMLQTCCRSHAHRVSTMRSPCSDAGRLLSGKMKVSRENAGCPSAKSGSIKNCGRRCEPGAATAPGTQEALGGDDLAPKTKKGLVGGATPRF